MCAAKRFDFDCTWRRQGNRDRLAGLHRARQFWITHARDSRYFDRQFDAPRDPNGHEITGWSCDDMNDFAGKDIPRLTWLRLID